MLNKLNLKKVFTAIQHNHLALLLSYALVAVFVAGVILLTPAIRYTPLFEPSVRDIDAQTFYREYSNNPGRFVFLDVRSQDVYTRLHATGAKLQPLHTLYTERKLLPRNDPNKTIVLICSGGLASGVGYSYLEHYGFRNVYRVGGGIEAWQAAGLPVEGTDVLK